MGKTLPSISVLFRQEQARLKDFARALPRSDRRALEELFSYTQLHLAEAAHAANPLPMEMFLLSMLLDQHKEVMRLRRQIEELQGEL
jgi:hypothetical protein